MQAQNSSTGAVFQAFFRREPHQCLRLAYGFTLLEILIVIVIIGITAVVASANLFPSDEEKLQAESERLLTLLQRARDEAAFGGRVIGVAVTADRIDFLERDIADITRWQASRLEDLHARVLADTMRAQVRVGGRVAMQPRATTADNSPIVFLPVGVAAPFDLTLSSATGSRRIAGDAIGNLTLSRDPA